jgi:hypothetical protein
MTLARTAFPLIAAILLATPAFAQVEAPGGGGGGEVVGPPAGGGDISLAPPSPPSQGGGTIIRETTVAAFLPNHSYTVNANIGSVNQQPIFANDLFRPIDATLRKIASTPHTDFRQAAAPIIHTQLQNMISEIIIDKAAEAAMTEDDRARVQIYVGLQRNQILSENGGSEAAAEAALAKEGTSVAKKLAELRRIFVRKYYFQKHLAPRIQITRAMVLAEYEKDPKKWQEPGSVELYTLTLPVSRWLRDPGINGEPGPIKKDPTAIEIANAEAQAMRVAKDIEKQLKAGEDFAKLVDLNTSSDGMRSKGGRWGAINLDSMTDPQLKALVSKLPANTLAEPLLIHQSDFRNSTVVITKVGKRVEPHTVTFEEKQEDIAKDLQDQMIRVLQDQEMKRLEKGATMEAVQRMEGVAIDAAVTRYATR